MQKIYIIENCFFQDSMIIFSNKEYPKKAKDLKGNEEDFSVDVITNDRIGMLNIAFWNYDTGKWGFHTDTLFDPYEGGKLMDFVWIYKPKLFEYQVAENDSENITEEDWDKIAELLKTNKK